VTRIDFIITRVRLREISAIERRLKRLDAAVREQNRVLRQVLSALNFNTTMEIAMNEDLKVDMENLRGEIEQTRGDYDSAKAMIAGLSSRLASMAASNSDATAMRQQLREYAANLNTMQEDFAKAVTATPSEGGGGTGEGGGNTDTGGTPGTGSTGGAQPNE
jgi:chromosome segregation ATPase